MSDTTITEDERAEWRERLTSKFSCFDAELGGFTLRLLNALEVTEGMLDGSVQETRANFSAVYQACTEIIPDLKAKIAESEARAEKAEADAKEWKEQIPEECPITGLPYFNSFKTSSGVYQPFYGGPCDVYGIPYKDEDGYLCRKRLCLDSMREEDENMCLEVVEEERMIDLGEAEANVARLTKMVDWLADKLETAVACPRGDLDLECPFGTSPGSEKCAAIIDHLPNKEVWGHCWKEAARRAVASGEG